MDLRVEAADAHISTEKRYGSVVAASDVAVPLRVEEHGSSASADADDALDRDLLSRVGAVVDFH